MAEIPGAEYRSSGMRPSSEGSPLLFTEFTAPRLLRSAHVQTLGAAIPLYAPPRSLADVALEALRRHGERAARLGGGVTRDGANSHAALSRVRLARARPPGAGLRAPLPGARALRRPRPHAPADDPRLRRRGDRPDARLRERARL